MDPRELAHVSCTPCWSVTEWTRRRGGAAGSVEPPRRIGEDRLERQLGGAEHRGVDAERRRHDLDERTRRAERSMVERVFDGRGDEAVEAGQVAAEHDARRVEHVDEAGESDPQPRPTSASAPSAVASPAAARASTASTAARPPSTGRPARASRAGSPTSVSQQPIEPHRQVRAGHRVDGHVPDLAAEAGDPGQRPAADDQPAAETDFPGQEDHVLGAGRRAPALLGEGAEVGFVGHRDRHGGAERGSERLSERDITPAEVRRRRHEAVVTTHDADDGHADPDEGVVLPRRRHAVGELAEVGDDVVDGEVTTRPIDAHEVDHVTTHARRPPRRVSRRRSRGRAPRRAPGRGGRAATVGRAGPAIPRAPRRPGRPRRDHRRAGGCRCASGRCARRARSATAVPRRAAPAPARSGWRAGCSRCAAPCHPPFVPESPERRLPSLCLAGPNSLGTDFPSPGPVSRTDRPIRGCGSIRSCGGS